MFLTNINILILKLRRNIVIINKSGATSLFDGSKLIENLNFSFFKQVPSFYAKLNKCFDAFLPFAGRFAAGKGPKYWNYKTIFRSRLIGFEWIFSSKKFVANALAALFFNISRRYLGYLHYRPFRNFSFLWNFLYLKIFI